MQEPRVLVSPDTAEEEAEVASTKPRFSIIDSTIIDGKEEEPRFSDIFRIIL